MTALNPITGEDEPYFPEKRRVHRMLAGSVVLLMMVRGPCHPAFSSASVFLSHRDRSTLPWPEISYRHKILTVLRKDSVPQGRAGAQGQGMRSRKGYVCTTRGPGRASPCVAPIKRGDRFQK